MTQRFHGWRLALPSIVSSLLLLGLCGAIAYSLHYLQTQTSEELTENIDSRYAAGRLSQRVEELLLAHARDATNVVDLQKGVLDQLERMEGLADKATESRLVGETRSEFNLYQGLWQQRKSDAIQHLERSLRFSNDLRDFNNDQVVLAKRQSQRTVEKLAWGLAGVGVAGSVGGLILGVAIMRWYRRGVRSLHVHVRAAAGALGQDLPPVEVAGDSLEELRGRVQLVVREVETVVLRLQQSEREVLRAEQLAAVGQLAAGMAHEIRNPLTAIKMLVDTQREDALSRGIPVDDYDLIRDELKRVERSLDSFLNFARLPRPEKSRQDLSRLVRQTISLLQGRAQHQKVKLEFHPPTTPVSVDADGGQIVQVLVNLALNALDAMPAGGTLRVELKAPAPDAVEVDLLDTGPGIAPEMLPRLFEPFASNKEAGLGLGLVTSRRIIEDHGGRLLATNRPGGGACFTVHLPAA
ncbi:MAG: hypothetical protein K1X57_07225 [Gemmataceae bacterium]|nr:hypothetical protein [Gemmataceae bacterium]